MAYFLYPETPAELEISTDVLSDNRVKFRVSQEYEHNPAHPFVAKVKNYVLEMFCDYEKYRYMRHLIFARLEEIISLENNLKAVFESKLKPEFKPEFEALFNVEYGAEKAVDIPEFMKEEVKQ